MLFSVYALISHSVSYDKIFGHRNLYVRVALCVSLPHLPYVTEHTAVCVFFRDKLSILKELLT